MAKDALYFLIPILIVAGILLWLGLYWTLLVPGALAAFVAFFFRDPSRVVPQGPGVIVSPADGRVVHVGREEGGIQISIFLSVLNVHINRSPIEGRIEGIAYVPGSFHLAFSEVARLENERNTLQISNSDFAVTCSQIAGVLARRIVCWKRSGDRVERGERIGLIRFGSRVDLLVPPAASLRVSVGDRVRGGSSAIAVMETSG